MNVQVRTQTSHVPHLELGTGGQAPDPKSGHRGLAVGAQQGGS